MRAARSGPLHHPLIRDVLGPCVALPLALLALAAVTTPLAFPKTGFDSDGLHYAVMAGAQSINPIEGRLAPWCWRVQTPLLVKALAPLGIAPLAGFRLVNFGANWLALVLLYGVLRRSSATRRGAVLGLLLYAGVFWALKFSDYSPAYVDPLTQVYLLAFLYCLVRGWYAVLPVVLTLGVTQKESLLAFAVVGAFVVLRSSRPRVTRLLLSAALIVPPIVVLRLLHARIVPANAYDPSRPILLNLHLLVAPAWRTVWIHAPFSGLGILFVWPLCFARRIIAELRRSPEWLLQILLGGGALLGGIDKGRLFLYMLPAVVVIAVRAASALIDRPGGIVAGWLGGTVLVQMYLGHWLTPMEDTAGYRGRMVPEWASAALSLPYLRIFLAVAAVWVAATWIVLRWTHAAPALEEEPAVH